MDFKKGFFKSDFLIEKKNNGFRKGIFKSDFLIN